MGWLPGRPHGADGRALVPPPQGACMTDAAVRWIDNHCHLHDERIPGGPAAAVAAARDRGVVAMVTVGCDRQTSLDAIAVAEQFDDVWATVGLHPHDAVKGVDSI